MSPKPKPFLYNFYWTVVELQAVLVSSGQQSESAIHGHISTLFKILSPYTKPKLLTINLSSLERQSGGFYDSVQSLNSTLCDPMEHTRLSCPSPSPGACSNSCPLSRWCHPAISSLSSSSPPAFDLSQHQGLFQRVSSLHQVAKVLELQLEHQSFQWIFRTDFL